MNIARKIKDPSSILIETVAAQLAATWYEIGRGQGLKSKWKTPQAYARANVEKFVPKAIEHLIDQLNNPYTPEENKIMIYDALSERVNDPDNITSTQIKGLPAIDIKKLIDNLPPAPPSQQLKPVRDKPISIKTALKSQTAIGQVKG
jgi:hypothetical protein